MNSILPLVPSSNFDQLVIPVFKFTGQCVIPKSLVGDGSKLVVALRSDAVPTPAVSTDSQSLAYNGIVFQYLANNQTFIVHSEWCGGSFTNGSCSLQTNLDGSLTFKRSQSDMKAMMEEWTFRSLPSTITVLPITKVQPVFQDMYVKRNANSITQLQQQFQIKIDQLLSNLSQ